MKLPHTSLLLALVLVPGAATLAGNASASSFDPQGNHLFDPDAVYTESFETIPSWTPGDPDAGEEPPPGAIPNLYVINADDALDGTREAGVDPANWWEGVSIPVALPPTQASYRARVWLRSGALSAFFIVAYKTNPAKQVLADLSPTGRCTSDGWTEYASAPFSVDGTDVAAAMLYMRGRAHIDAFEVVSAGTYQPETSCFGAFDPACGDDAVCIDGVCRPGAMLVPSLPPPAERDQVVDLLRTRLQYFFGGHKTRRDKLPAALEEIERMRSATRAWPFWHSFATAVRKLGDWHTSASGLIDGYESSRRLNVCFIEGDADLSHTQSPPDEDYLDVLVSHVGPDRNADLRPGDRLVAVDGVHPIAWARSLVDVSWDWWEASDGAVNAEFVEILRGLIPKYAITLSVLRCDASSDTCAATPEVIQVRDLHVATDDEPGLVQCDNRPAYHVQNGPDPETHSVGYQFYKGLLVDSEPGENLYGVTWDTLGEESVAFFTGANQEFKQHARGVILDHRAGNGGIIDGPETVSQLVHERFRLALVFTGRPYADYGGPETQAEGLALFKKYDPNFASIFSFTVGSTAPKLDLPVALLMHRDGSASDYLVYGMQGPDKVRIFGPHQSAGAFSTFYNLDLPGTMRLQMASGDTITHQGKALIGNGAPPDEIVLPLQSDLIHGRDTIYLRALAWIRSELKP